MVIDEAKALRRAVLDVFDHPVLGRCQLHKIRNVRDRLPERLRSTVAKRMRATYHADSVLDAEAQLTALARELDKTHPGAAASLPEGVGTASDLVYALPVSPKINRDTPPAPASPQSSDHQHHSDARPSRYKKSTTASPGHNHPGLHQETAHMLPILAVRAPLRGDQCRFWGVACWSLLDGVDKCTAE